MSEYKLLKVSGGWNVLKGDSVLWPEPSEETALIIFSLLEQETTAQAREIAALQAKRNRSIAR